MRKLLWSLAAIGSLLGALGLISAPKIEYVIISIGFAVIPYCLARAASELQILKEEDSWESTSEEDDS